MRKTIEITPELMKMTPIELVSYIKGNRYEVAIVRQIDLEVIRRLKKENIEVLIKND
jgi:hypothetical protein